MSNYILHFPISMNTKQLDHKIVLEETCEIILTLHDMRKWQQIPFTHTPISRLMRVLVSGKNHTQLDCTNVSTNAKSPHYRAHKSKSMKVEICVSGHPRQWNPHYARTRCSYLIKRILIQDHILYNTILVNFNLRKFHY